MIEASKKPNNKNLRISVVMPELANSVPPLNPMEKSKYKAKKPLEALGISKSLFTILAKTPNKKNKSVGFDKLNVNNSKLNMRLFFG